MSFALEVVSERLLMIFNVEIDFMINLFFKYSKYFDFKRKFMQNSKQTYILTRQGKAGSPRKGNFTTNEVNDYEDF